MALADDIRHIEVNLLEKLRHGYGRVVDQMQRRRVYRTTLNELGQMTTRDLNDLGIDRSAIHSIAYQAAYGK